LSYRTGHGIGLDGHEDAYLVHGDATPLEPGMCFSADLSGGSRGALAKCAPIPTLNNAGNGIKRCYFWSLGAAMRTTLALDDELVAEAQVLTG
jgi:Xaa-Pro aminopeptidase